MFGFHKKESAGEKVTFTISGMHCTSCSINIDGELEDTKGVLRADTSYAKATTTVQFDPNLVSIEALKKVVEALGYVATIK